MHPVIQEEKTGCAIASCAAIAGLSYQQAQSIARFLGIYADDPALKNNIRTDFGRIKPHWYIEIVR